MTYPLKPHQQHDAKAIELHLLDYPFAHLFTSSGGKQLVTRLPFMLDLADGSPSRLRAHMNAQNPQTESLDGSDALVAFSGPDSYVSPNWRLENTRGATWDYTAVHVWGRVTLRPEREFFERLIIDLADAAEKRLEGLSDKPNWTFSNVTRDYVDRLFPHLLAFEVAIDQIEAISKLHQNFPVEDALSVAAHMERSDNSSTRAVGAMIKRAAEDR